MFRKERILGAALLMVLPSIFGNPAVSDPAVSGQFWSNFDTMSNVSASDGVNAIDGSLVLSGTYARWLLPTGEAPGTIWRYTISSPGAAWYSTSYDDGSWPGGQSPFGKDYNTALNPRTEWSSSDIWVRTTFHSRYGGPELSVALLRLYHDETVTIYLNGALLYSASGYTSKYVELALSLSQKAMIRNGTNIIAAQCHQTSYAQGIDLGLFACIADLEVKTGETPDQVWRYTTASPGNGWNARDYNDGAWSSGSAPFGFDYDTNLDPRTFWNSQDIWIRRTFEYGSSPGRAWGLLRFWHDEGLEVYLNGQALFDEEGYTSSYIDRELDPSVLSSLVEGTNILAAHCSQTIYACGIDIGLTLFCSEDEGNATTTTINAPAGERFRALNCSYLATGSSSVRISVLDPDTLAPFPGLADLAKMDVDLSALKVSGLKLRFNLLNGGHPPEVNWYCVTWEPDLPGQGSLIPNTYTLYEDTSVPDLIDLGTYFSDDLFDIPELVFSVEYESLPNNLHAMVRGRFLGFNTTSPDWYGNASFQVGCSNGYHSILSNKFSVEVVSVFDAPVLAPIPRLYVPEHGSINYHFDATDGDFVLDPKEMIAYTSDSAFPQVTPEGWMNFTATADRIGEHPFNLTVTDRNGARSSSRVDLTINNTNDPPGEVVIVEPANGTTVKKGRAITFRARSSDPDSDPLNYTWRDAKGNVIGYGKELETNRLGTGTHLIRVVVSDGKLSGTSDAVAVKVVADKTAATSGFDAAAALLAGLFAGLLMLSGRRLSRRR